MAVPEPIPLDVERRASNAARSNIIGGHGTNHASDQVPERNAARPSAAPFELVTNRRG
jgi:hypothetical protein